MIKANRLQGTGYGIVSFLRFYTHEGELVPTPEETAQQEKVRADQQRERADREKERSDRLMAKLR